MKYFISYRIFCPTINQSQNEGVPEKQKGYILADDIFSGTARMAKP